MAETSRNTSAQDAAMALPGVVPAATLDGALGADVWNRFVEQIKSNPAYSTTDETGTLPAVLWQYGEGPNDYVVASEEAGSVSVVNGADPTGKRWNYPLGEWRKFVRKLRGEETDEDKAEAEKQGPTQYEEAAKFQKRTNEKVAEDRDAASGQTAGRVDRPGTK